jgi:2-methylcitrate dehydratase PrpD
VPGDRASHLTSVQYCMATAALAPEGALDVQASPPELTPELRSFMDKIVVSPDESLLAGYPRSWPARVCVTAGSVRQERLVTHVPGDPARPFDRARVRDKFLRFTVPVVGEARAEDILRSCTDALATSQFAALVDKIEAATRLLDRPHAEEHRGA